MIAVKSCKKMKLKLLLKNQRFLKNEFLINNKNIIITDQAI